MSSAQPAQTLASNLITQTLQSINLLESLSLLSSSDANLIRTKLPSPNGPFPSLSPPQPPQQRSDLTTSFDNLNVSAGPSSPNNGNTGYGYQAPPNLPARGRPLPNGPQESRAKALWDYRGNESDDLAFRAGDIIVIDEEVNAQWYRGRVIPQGQNYPLDRSGLFPSNYVEKLQNNQNLNGYFPPPPPQAMVPYSGPPPQQYGQYQDPVPYGQIPKPDYNNQMVTVPPAQQQQIQQQQSPQAPPEHKNGKLGKIGATLGNAAVQGAGWGFGTTVGGQLAHAIF